MIPEIPEEITKDIFDPEFLESIADLLQRTVEKFTVDDGDLGNYLERWYPFRILDRSHPAFEHLSQARKTLGVEPLFHLFSRSDSDRALHDHPWDFLTIVLSGGYIEEVPVEGTSGWCKGDRIRIVRKPGDITFRRAEDKHRVELHKRRIPQLDIENGRGMIMVEKEIPSWSIVLRGRKRRTWGFWEEDGWVDYETFLDRQYGVGKWRREVQLEEEELHGRNEQV